MTISLTTPQIVRRSEQPYVAVGASLTMAEMGTAVPALFNEIISWVGPPRMVGPPFVKFDVIDMERETALSVGVPVAAGTAADGRVVAGILPEGRYLTATHTGPYDRLVEATAQFLAWAAEHWLEFDVRDTPRGQQWVARLEEYLTDPAAQPDPEQWETVLAFRLRD
jgi:effector-binding domain-containing protein